MNNFGNDIITYIFEYIVEKKYNCVLTMEDKTRHEYTKNTKKKRKVNTKQCSTQTNRSARTQ